MRTRKHKYMPGYIQGALQIQCPSSEYGRYIVYCHECQEITDVSVMQLSMGKTHCGCLNKKTYTVYFFHDLEQNRVKIGYTTNTLNTRLSVLRTGSSSFGLVPINAIQGDKNLERYTKQYFHKHHIVREWFEYAEEMRTVTADDIYQAHASRFIE